MKLTLLTTTMLFLTTNAMAQHSQSHNAISETGQSQFAAIAEIVTVLRNDPDTDWSQVDIDALRTHLVDMDNLTTRAIVDKAVDGLSVTSTVTGDPSVALSIQRMVLAHSPILQDVTGWSVNAKIQGDGATMSVEVASADEVEEVAALGFFGWMTIGAHHQQHHLMIAEGHSPH